MALAVRMRKEMKRLTAAERKVATAVLADFPFAGLLTVAELAERANVSGQTTLRFVGKLGFSGYGDFQRALIGEIKESFQSPIALRASGQGIGAGEQLLDRLAETACARIRETVAALPPSEFEAVCTLLGDRSRSIFLLGGRISDSIATYLFSHLRQIRPKVFHVPADREVWPEYLLRMSRRDVVVLVDFRRYQSDLDIFAEQVSEQRGARIVLLTDKWLSPIAKHSSHVLAAEIDVGTAWDTAITPLLLVEGIIVSVAESDWDRTQARIEAWDRLRPMPQGR